MKRAVFEIKQTPTGNYYFIFKDLDGEKQVVSSSFQNRAELEICLSKVRSAAPLSDIRIELDDKIRYPYFLIQKQREGFIFSLIGFVGEYVFSSVVYKDETSCRQALEVIKSNVVHAAVLDLTTN